MEYIVKKIRTREEISGCTRFEVNHFQWVDGPKPETWGYMGYLEGEGLYVEMFCRETNPRRETKEEEGRLGNVPGHRVCDDSSMEIFLGFPKENGQMEPDSMYVNFEINAGGVMYANYGKGRKNRSFLTDEVYEATGCQAEICEDYWKIKVLFPEKFLEEISGKKLSDSDTEIYCNFYKISETPEIEHYASFSEIKNETPNFHMPQFFARAVLEK